MSAARLRDSDGDEWVLREDGWCCQAPCDCTGELAQHPCSEHDHFARPRLDVLFGPLTEVPS